MTKSSAQHQWTAGLWKILSCACFALINGIVRYMVAGSSLATASPLSEGIIQLFQNVFGTVWMLPLLFVPQRISLKTHHPMRHLIRIFTAVLGVFLWYRSLYYMDIATAVALSFTGPVATVVLARIYLKEHLDSRRTLAIFVSFIGSFIIMRPDRIIYAPYDASFNWPLLLPLFSAIAIACSKILTRDLALKGEAASTMTLYLLVFMTPISLIFALINWTPVATHHWPWLFAMGGLATLAHYSSNQSYVKGDVTFVTPFGFAKFLLSAAVGYLAFGEIPQSQSLWIGTSIIFTSVIILSLKRRRNV